MGTSKTEVFSEAQNEMAALLNALAHPARVAIFEYLLQKKECVCSEIVEELPLAQSTISQHLKEMKKAGLISGNVEGRNICYCLNQISLAKLSKYFGVALDKYESGIKYCC